MRRPKIPPPRPPRYPDHHPATRYCRPEVLAFAVLMERKLRENDFKGGWGRDTAASLCRRAREELDELWGIIPHWTQQGKLPADKRRELGSEAADVANMAMMVADVCGCLKDCR